MKLVVVTGASKGLGLSISKILTQHYKVVGIARNKSEEFEKLEKQGAVFEPFDFSQTSKIQELIVNINKKYGKIYALINNAAIGKDGVLATMHEQDINELINVNIKAPIITTKYAIRSMLLNGSGRVINIGSIIGSTGFNGLSVYGASKAALHGFTKSLSREIGKANITVNTIAPGYMQTDMSSSIDDENLEKIKRRSPLKRLAKTQDVANMVKFLLSEEANNITGTIFTIDAGSTA